MGFTPEQAQQFADKVRQAALTRKPPLDASAEELAKAAALYAANLRVWPVKSLAFLEQFFECNGFSIDLMDGKIVAGHAGKSESGPTTPDGANYVHMIATRL